MIKTAGVSKGMAKWIEDFITGLSKKAENEQFDINSDDFQTTLCDPNVNPETEQYFNGDKTAAININDLPKVVWNDETFYVLFDKEFGNATILNKFTNVVTTVKATNIEEVDDALNSLQIVSEKNDDLNLKTAEEISEELSKEIETNEQYDDFIEEEIINENNQSEIIDKMQSQINDLTKQIEIIKQQYARTNNFNNLDIGAEALEVEHFNETANETAKKIEEDNLKDITTPKGRFSLREKLLNDINKVIVNDDIEDDKLYNYEDEKKLQEKTRFEHLNVVKEQMYMEDDSEQENKLDDFYNEEENEFEILNDKDSNIFKQAICPDCNGQLMKANVVGSFQGIVCHGKCKSEYAVNLDNEMIFKKRGEK